MPKWNNDKKRYDEQETRDVPNAPTPADREESFRTALLNELDIIGRALQALEDR